MIKQLSALVWSKLCLIHHSPGNLPPILGTVSRRWQANTPYCSNLARAFLFALNHTQCPAGRRRLRDRLSVPLQSQPSSQRRSTCEVHHRSLSRPSADHHQATSTPPAAFCATIPSTHTLSWVTLTHSVMLPVSRLKMLSTP